MRRNAKVIIEAENFFTRGREFVLKIAECVTSLRTNEYVVLSTY